MVVEDGLQHVALEPAVVVLAVQREELGQAEVRGLFDSAVELDERHAQAPRQPAADGRLAGAAQSEQGDDRLGILARQRDERRRRDLEGARDVGEAADRDVAAARLELHEEARRNAGALCDVAQRPPTLEPSRPRPLAERSQEIRSHKTAALYYALPHHASSCVHCA